MCSINGLSVDEERMRSGQVVVSALFSFSASTLIVGCPYDLCHLFPSLYYLLEQVEKEI